jgi:phosphoserine aminotransferase
MSVMEMSHRGPEFISIYQQAVTDLRELLAVPANYKILFLQGGGLGENAIVPMNLAGRRAQPATIDFVHPGTWSGKSIREAARRQRQRGRKRARQPFTSCRRRTRGS